MPYVVAKWIPREISRLRFLHTPCVNSNYHFAFPRCLPQGAADCSPHVHYCKCQTILLAYVNLSLNSDLQAQVDEYYWLLQSLTLKDYHKPVTVHCHKQINLKFYPRDEGRGLI